MHFLLEARKEPYLRYGEGVLEGKNVQELKKTAVRPALLDGRLAGAKVVTL